jgi:hypothetical protein
MSEVAGLFRPGLASLKRWSSNSFRGSPSRELSAGIAMMFHHLRRVSLYMICGRFLVSHLRKSNLGRSEDESRCSRKPHLRPSAQP